jgi:deoxyribodipyrimidine photolyase-related protein
MPSPGQPLILRLILGDQLNPEHPWLRAPDSRVTYILMEVRQETDYAHHHIQKVLGFFQAMRAFRDHLLARNHKVRYLSLDDPRNKQTIPDNLRQILREGGFRSFEYQLPDEYRVDEQLKRFCSDLTIPTAVADTEHFLTTRMELAEFFADRKTHIMESFYRHMRRKHDVLMDDGKPLGGRWNYDPENRGRLSREAESRIPEPLGFRHDVAELLRMIEAAGVRTIGSVVTDDFPWPRDRKEALKLLDHFLEHSLPDFGRFQDALSAEHPVLFHSRLSFALNTKMISPMEVIRKAVERWHADEEEIGISQVEGFVRQILGWREYLRGIYWEQMPGYAELNFLGHARQLPGFYWSGETRMNCLRCTIRQSLQSAYAHHIQRLMITGNFALLAGVDPDAVDRWYLGIYIDALQWVEITNTRGMSQFADGGFVGTKPYVSSASYISRMSDYCKACSYDAKKRSGSDACPFNSLYWNFYHRHRALLEGNPRIGFVYKTLDRMSEDDHRRILDQADEYLRHVEEL